MSVSAPSGDATPAAPPVGLAGATALAWLAVWPVVMGIFTAFAGMPALMARPVTVVIAAICFVIAGLAARTAGGLRFARWQVVLAAIALAVVFGGLDAEAPDIFAVAVRLAIFAGGAGAALWLSRQGEAGVRLLLHVLIGSMLLYIAFFILLHGVFLARSGGIWTTAFYPFVNVRQFTNTLTPVTVVAMLLWAQAVSGTGHGADWRGAVPVMLGLAALALATTIFWTGGRGPVLAMLCGLSVALWIAPRPDRAALARRLGALLAVASVLSVIIPRPPVHSFGFWQRLLKLPGAETLDEVTSRRAGLWTETWQLVLEKPLFGHGFNNWLAQNPDFVFQGSPHNFPLEVLHDLGFVGGGAVLALVFATAILRLRQARLRRGVFPVAVAMLWTMLAHSGVDAIFWSYTSLMLATLCFAMCYAAQPQEDRADGP